MRRQSPTTMVVLFVRHIKMHEQSHYIVFSATIIEQQLEGKHKATVLAVQESRLHLVVRFFRLLMRLSIQYLCLLLSPRSCLHLEGKKMISLQRQRRNCTVRLLCYMNVLVRCVLYANSMCIEAPVNSIARGRRARFFEQSDSFHFRLLRRYRN